MRAGEGSAGAASAPGGAGGGRRRGTGLGDAAAGTGPAGMVTRGGGVASGRRPLPDTWRAGGAAPAAALGPGAAPGWYPGSSRGASPRNDGRRPLFSGAAPLAAPPARADA